MDVSHREVPAVDTSNSERSLIDLNGLADCLLSHLDGDGSWSCRPVWFHRKMKKQFVEFELAPAGEPSKDFQLRRCIGKVYATNRGQGHFDALCRLWNVGFRPPSPYTVVYPIAYIADSCVLLQEKAPGRPLAHILFGRIREASKPLALTAGWLAALHAANLDFDSRLGPATRALKRYGCELAEVLPGQSARVERLVVHALAELESDHLTPLVPSHGDFHPKNVFLDDCGRVTIIDLDTFGGQERAADVAYFLGQTAIMGHRHLGSFAATTQARDLFLQHYLDAAPLPRERLALYLGMCFLQSLHYELCVWHTGNNSIVEPWLVNAESCLLAGKITLTDKPAEVLARRKRKVLPDRQREALIKPYGGGKLVNLVVSEMERDEVYARALTLPRIQLTPRSLCDLELLATGGFSPLDRFLGKNDYQCVLEEQRLEGGTLFPIPVTFAVDPCPGLRLDGEVALTDQRNNVLAVMRVEEVYEWDLQEEAQSVCGTTDTRHPLVAEMHAWGKLNISGELKVLALPRHYDFGELRLSPALVRERLSELGRHNVVAFQTRNPLHRAHEELTKRAASQIDGTLLLHPVAGITKPGDIDHYTRVRSYRIVVDRHYDHNRTVLALLPLAMRMAGPREAVWHSIIRRNFGANYLIVGRDHASPGLNSEGQPFYRPHDAQECLSRYSVELGVQAIPFKELVYLPDEDCYEEVGLLPKDKRRVSLSGTAVRESYLERGRSLPKWFTHREVASILRQAYPPRHQQGFCVWFTGLSGSGKTTTAEILISLLLEHGRQVTLLDGDVVRTHLSKGLGFSKEDRDLNIRRIGFVASEIVRHRGAVVCAAVSPYRSTRNECRALVGEDRFIEIFVDTPLEVCEQRDPKGFYARALAGKIKDFTGIEDPYELPESPEITLDTVRCSADENARRILSELGKRGFILQLHRNRTKPTDQFSVSPRKRISDTGKIKLKPAVLRAASGR